MKSFKNKWLAFWKNDEIESLKQEISNLKVILQASQSANHVAYTELSSLVANSRSFASGGFLGRRALGRKGEEDYIVRKTDPEFQARLAAEMAKNPAVYVTVDSLSIGTSELAESMQEHIRSNIAAGWPLPKGQCNTPPKVPTEVSFEDIRRAMESVPCRTPEEFRREVLGEPYSGPGYQPLSTPEQDATASPPKER